MGVQACTRVSSGDVAGKWVVVGSDRIILLNKMKPIQAKTPYIQIRERTVRIIDIIHWVDPPVLVRKYTRYKPVMPWPMSRIIAAESLDGLKRYLVSGNSDQAKTTNLVDWAVNKLNAFSRMKERPGMSAQCVFGRHSRFGLFILKQLPRYKRG